MAVKIQIHLPGDPESKIRVLATTRVDETGDLAEYARSLIEAKKALQVLKRKIENERGDPPLLHQQRLKCIEIKNRDLQNTLEAVTKQRQKLAHSTKK